MIDNARKERERRLYHELADMAAFSVAKARGDYLRFTLSGILDAGGRSVDGMTCVVPKEFAKTLARMRRMLAELCSTDSGAELAWRVCATPVSSDGCERMFACRNGKKSYMPLFSFDIGVDDDGVTISLGADFIGKNGRAVFRTPDGGDLPIEDMLASCSCRFSDLFDDEPDRGRHGARIHAFKG